MSPQARKEYFKAVWLRYKKTTSKSEKSKILDELCANCHFNRKYARLEDPLIGSLLNDLYKNEWRLFHNFFMPSVKLKAKERIGSKIIKRHDSPKTPYQRILDSKFIPPHTKQVLKEQFKTLNPFKLKKTIDKRLPKSIVLLGNHQL